VTIMRNRSVMKIVKHCLFVYAALSLAALTLIVSDSTGFSVQLFGKDTLPFGVDKWLFLVAVLGLLIGVLLALNPSSERDQKHTLQHGKPRRWFDEDRPCCQDDANRSVSSQRRSANV